DPGLDFGDRSEIAVDFLGRFDLFGANGSVHRLFLCFAEKRARTSPARRSEVVPSGLPILTASGPICGNAGSFSGELAKWANALPAALEARAKTLVGGAGEGFADRTGDGD